MFELRSGGGRRWERMRWSRKKGKNNLSHCFTPQWDAEGPNHVCWQGVIHGLIDCICNNVKYSGVNSEHIDPGECSNQRQY